MRSGSATRVVLAPLVACIVALALYPGLILGRSDAAVKDKIAATVSRRGLERPAPQLPRAR